MSKKAFSILLGKCVPSVKPNAAKVCITTMELDENLLMYFPKMSYLYAHDPDKMCKNGDIVLVEKLENKLSKLLTHKVAKVVYPLGDVMDPLTGKKVVAWKYREDVIERSKLFGRNKNAFDYDSAPPRGWQEGVKDFTAQDTYVKYNEYPDKKQPFAV